MSLINSIFVTYASLGLVLSTSPNTIPVSSIQQSSSSPFSHLGGFPSARILNCDDGYVYYNFDVYKASFTVNSNLYIAHSETSFTPGHVARANNTINNETGRQYKDYWLKKGYVHFTLSSSTQNNQHGGTIYPIAFWPKSTDVSTTVSSSVSSSYTFSFNQTSSISLGDGATLSLGGSQSNSFNFTFSSGLSSVTQDPQLSAQYGSNNLETQWNFEVISTEIAGGKTFTFHQYVLFEMANDGQLNADSFDLTYSLQYTGQYLGWLNHWHNGWDFSNSILIRNFY